MARQCVVVIVLAATMVGSANADAVDTKFATLVRSGTTISVSDDYVLASKYLTLGAVIYAVFCTALSVHLAIRLYKSHNLGMRLASNIGLAAIGLPPSLTFIARQLGFLKIDGSLDVPSAWVGGTSIVCITINSIITHLFAPHSLGSRAATPQSSISGGMSEPDPSKVQVPNKSRAVAEEIVEEGLPAAAVVVTYLIEKKIEAIAGEDAYEGLSARLRSGIINIILNQHRSYTIIQDLHATAPPDSPLPDNGGRNLVRDCRSSALNKINAFINVVDLFKADLVRYRDRATPT
jgi:hypothetical protein